MMGRRFLFNFAGYGLAFAVGDAIAQRRRARRAAARQEMSHRAAAAVVDLIVLDAELRGLEPAPAAVVVDSPCVCCRSGAATWPAP